MSFKHHPSISVVVPAFNVERYIEEAVDSLLAQTEKFYEIIVVDDGSTDATAQRLAKYADCDSIRIVHTANQGLGPARNEGLQHASGDFVYFMDSDDFILPHFVTTIGTIIRKNPSVDLIFYSGEIFFDPDYPSEDRAHVRRDEFRRRVTGLYPSGLDAVAALLATKMFSPSACLYVSRRSLWNADLRFKPIVHEDDEVITRLCARARVTCITRSPLYMRRMRAGSIMHARTSRRNTAGYFTALASTWQIYSDTRHARHRPVLRRQFYLQAWQYLHTCRRAGITPTFHELLFLVRRLRHIPRAELLRAMLPLTLRQWIRQGKRLFA
nr:glycosyltransferase family 2 protein [uncultured Massilia sp.]